MNLNFQTDFPRARGNRVSTWGRNLRSSPKNEISYEIDGTNVIIDGETLSVLKLFLDLCEEALLKFLGQRRIEYT